MDRAYSFLEIKSLDEDQRTIRGLATTPEADRMGDIVEPKGAQFKLPIPLLWQHDKGHPIGKVTAARVTDAGIEIDAHIPKGVTDRIDEAWALIKAGIVSGLSIGFKPRDVERIKAADDKSSTGLRFKTWEWLELSCVTVPANAGASISIVKSIDRELLTASGQSQLPVVRLVDPPPGVSGTQAKPASAGFLLPERKTPITMKTTAEQITAFESKRTASAARMADIMQKAADAGETLDETTEQEYETLGREVKSVDIHLGRLRAHEQIVVSKAVEVTPGNTANPAAASDVRGGIITVKSNVAKGTAFARYVRLLACSHGNLMQAAEMAKQYDDSTPEVGIVLKAAVNAGSTTDANFASALVPYRIMTSEFIAFLRPATILGKFGTNGVPSMRQVPFNIKMPSQTGGSTVNWVGQMAPKPVSALTFASLTLDFTKTAGIVVISEELARLSTPSAEAIITQDMVEQTAQFLDQSFINPALAAVAGVSPASITNGATSITASGTDASAVRGDLRRLIATFQVANLSAAGAVWVMTETQATALSMMVNALGQAEFPDITAMGGTLFGIPVVTSENVTQTSVGSPPVVTAPIVLIKASEILLADDGQVTIDVSREASLQMDSAPTNPPVAATVMVSLWQMNMIGIRAERWINWVRRRTGSVAYISNANYGTV